MLQVLQFKLVILFLNFRSKKFNSSVIGNDIRICSHSRIFSIPAFKSTFLKKYCLHTCVFLWSIYVYLDQFLYFTVLSFSLEELNDFLKFNTKLIKIELNQLKAGLLIKRLVMIQ